MKNYIKQLQHFLASKKGRRFWHICYSWGASVVLIGAMFKILHYPYANELLMLGMTAEALIFFLSAFDTEYGEPQEKSVKYSHTEKTAYKLPEQVKELSGFISSLNNVSKEIERHTINYGLQIQQMNRNLKELNTLYEYLLEGLKADTHKHEDDNPENEDEILI